MRWCGLLWMLGLSGAVAAAEVVQFDFESGDLQGWRIVEGSFPLLLTDRATFHHTGEPYVKQGRWFLSTLERPDGRPDDSFTGVVESPVVVLSGPTVRLLVGGGSHESTHVALCALDGRELARAGGRNAQLLQAVTWEVPAAVGQPVYLRLIDDQVGGWGHLTLDDVQLTGRLDPLATESRWRSRRRLLATTPVVGTATSAAALLAHLERVAPARRRDLQALAGQLAALGPEPSDEQLTPLLQAAYRCHPQLAGRELLYVVRAQYKPDHHNTETLFQTGEINTASFVGGGALRAVDLASGRTRTLWELPQGIVRDPEVHFDGQRVIVAGRRQPDDDYHLYELPAAGGAPIQLTRQPGISDIDPLYLPDGDIVFSSTREPKYCMCNRHIMANLHRMTAGGGNIEQIAKSTLFEGHAALLPDGRLLYDRWEYVDRNFGDAQGLWTCHPDGTNQAIWYGNNTSSPGGVIHGRAVGSDRVLAILGSCHDRPWGALGLLDRQRGVDGAAAVLRTWPASAAKLIGQGNWDAFLPVRPKYQDPYPLDDNVFLCARQTGVGEQMGLYALDTFGNEVLLHVEGPGCFDPQPLGPRVRPPVIPSRLQRQLDHGWFYVADVYQGTHLAGVERGSVTALRVVESPEKRTWTHAFWGGQGTIAPAMNWHDFANKRVLGTVPVEADGSVYFQAPAGRFVYFQLLDAAGRMVQSMRSGTMLRPGERAGCGGCHESRLHAPEPQAAGLTAALRRPPRQLQPWHGEERLFSFRAEVQPAFDHHCLPCHDYGGAGAAAVVLAGDRDLVFNASYHELWRKRLVRVVGAGPAAIQAARSWGSTVSPLAQVALSTHHGVTLDAVSRDRILTWIDLNAPYYPRYECAWPDHLAGRCPLSNAELQELSQLTGVPLLEQATCQTRFGPQVSFERPERSPCLESLRANPTAQAAALALIERGAARLRQRPEADSPGFVPCPADQQRLAKYDRLAARQAAVREALQRGELVFDAPPAAP
ncbi:MAG: hypothetical protein IT204_18510 [Fimbriimonadaceae bacterium]|nr:hypothetical protein [Fimbriimonadaceae bacterium]